MMNASRRSMRCTSPKLRTLTLSMSFVGKHMKHTIVQAEIKKLSAVPTPLAEAQETQNFTLEATTTLTRTYQPYPWQLANQVLDFVDGKTGGKAGQIQRILSYLLFGGLAAVVNLVVFGLVLYRFHFPISVSTQVHNIFAFIIAAECSMMANFLPNDRFTFISLPGAKRPWLQRCLRFHATCIVGTLLTFLLEFAFFSLLHTPELLAEALAIVIVLIYNLTFHHLFTYRRIKQS
jgi:putative flippase GtrA